MYKLRLINVGDAFYCVRVCVVVDRPFVLLYSRWNDKQATTVDSSS
jgi:hypothetical protein